MDRYQDMSNIHYRAPIVRHVEAEGTCPRANVGMVYFGDKFHDGRFEWVVARYGDVDDEKPASVWRFIAGSDRRLQMTYIVVHCLDRIDKNIRIITQISQFKFDASAWAIWNDGAEILQSLGGSQTLCR